MKADPSGCLCWFDPSREQVKLYELDPADLSGVASALEMDDPHYEGGALDQVTSPLQDLPGEGLPF